MSSYNGCQTVTAIDRSRQAYQSVPMMPYNQRFSVHNCPLPTLGYNQIPKYNKLVLNKYNRKIFVIILMMWFCIPISCQQKNSKLCLLGTQWDLFIYMYDKMSSSCDCFCDMCAWIWKTVKNSKLLMEMSKWIFITSFPW